jgi:L-amino acid N-acyltransferase YncA
MIRPVTLADAESVCRIYNHYVTDTVVTFEEETVSPSAMARRIEGVRSASLPWLVAELEGQVVGYAYANRWKERSAYRFSTEITVYLDPAHAGRGLGSRLYGGLFPILQDLRMRAVIGGIALPNAASVALHEKFGMQQVAHFKEVGFKLDRWVDVGYWQRTL